MTFETIRLQKQDRIGIITLNRPKSLNAINRVLLREVTSAMTGCNHDPSVNAIVIHGEGRAFCAGFDIKEGGGSDERDGDAWRRWLIEDFDFMMQFWDSPKPTIAAVHGFCLAGGFEIALACDMAIAAQGTRFGAPEVRIGASIFCMLLPWMTTPKIAKELLLTGNDRIDAERALSVGLINEVVEPGAELNRALALAADLGASSPPVVRLTKAAINQAYDIMGMRAALMAAIDKAVIVETTGRAERNEFNRIRDEKGLKAALDWRDARFERPSQASPVS